MRIKKIYIGGWFQRTTLHLSEMWEFLAHATSSLAFEKKDLAKALAHLNLNQVTRESGPLEYILAQTKTSLQYRIYEDGLIILEHDASSALKKDLASIKEYYDTRLSKSLSFIFSKGAPVPKELANIATILPYIITIEGATEAEVKKLFKDLGEEAYSLLSSKEVEVYRGNGLILINNLHSQELAREIIETQIFFREFKTQLHRYLEIHRTVWEKIEGIKERGRIKGEEINLLLAELHGYKKTITLIDARIAQMDAYLITRQKITDSKNIDEYLRPLFQFKFETLLDTHRYIQRLWTMTKDYLNSAIDVCTELQQRSTKSSLSSLQLITTIGVVAGIIGYLGKDSLPTFTLMGGAYFVLLLILTWIVNACISKIYRHRSYKISINTEKISKKPRVASNSIEKILEFPRYI